MFRKVLLCYEKSAAGGRALARGAELATTLAAEVHVLSIIPEAVVRAPMLAMAAGVNCLVEPQSHYETDLRESLSWLRQRGVAAKGYLASGNTVEQIERHSKHLKTDLVVLGHFPRAQAGFWWSRPHTEGSLTERLGCCVFIAADPARDSGCTL